jgi:hypothetical protein
MSVLPLTANEVRRVFAYGPETGLLTRIAATGSRSRLGHAARGV